MSFRISIPKNVLPLSALPPEGSIVDLGEGLKEYTESEFIVDLSAELSIKPNDIFKHIRVSLGEQVQTGMALAEKKTFFTTSIIRSPREGEIRAINHLNGTITLASRRVEDVPFLFRGRFSKAAVNELIFNVEKGMSAAVTVLPNKTVGGECSYIKHENEITLENCENKVVICDMTSTMNISKIAALSSLALVCYRSTYHAHDLTQLVVKHKDEWNEIWKEKFPLCLYSEGTDSAYFYSM